MYIVQVLSFLELSVTTGLTSPVVCRKPCSTYSANAVSLYWCNVHYHEKSALYVLLLRLGELRHS